jgi:predicted ATPase
MLTRLRVTGFKNLVGVDVSFGPFTCIAGANGVGKSNLFDAITFLSALADRPLMDAAKSVRDERHRATDVRSLFLKLGTEHAEQMSFEAEMLVPESGQDDLGQTAKASITFLVYRLTLGLRREPTIASGERIEVVAEELRHINVGDARKHLGFPHSAVWRKSVVKGRRVGPFLSTEGEGAERRIRLHQDGRSGMPREYVASQLPRTVLSSTNALESPTALLARREMQSWRLLQLEPSSLRQPDSFHAPVHVGVDGSHLASTLQHLARREAENGGAAAEGSVFARVANALSALVDDVREVRVDEDRQRELFTLQVVDRDGNLHAARSLSDGTLRFLALAVLELDPEARGLLCFEEPENGIHPARIPAMLRLLKGLCVGVDEPVGPDNPLRQVIVNTHSPAVVGLVEDDDLLVAVPREVAVGEKRCQAVAFSWLTETWRQGIFPDVRPVSRGLLGAYLNPLAVRDDTDDSVVQADDGKRRQRRRVKDRKDLQALLPFMAEE